MANAQTLILIDGSSYLYRAFHALPPLMTTNGQATGAIKGVVDMIRKLFEEYPSDHAAVVFDAKGKTFRDDLYDEYKANREAMPDDLRAQIEPLYDIIDALGFPRLVVPGVEADDVIGTLAKQAEALGWSTVISTGDKDMAQLVTPAITLVNTMNDSKMDEQGVYDKFSVRPDQIIDYLALVGDTSDNIPGVPKVGPKTAAKWLAAYDTVDELINQQDAITGKVGENLRNNIDQLRLSQVLTTIKTDVDLEVSPETLIKGERNHDRLLELYEALEFKSWIRRLKDGGSTDGDESASAPQKNYTTILTWPDWQACLDQLKASKRFALDTETTALDYMVAELVGISVSTAEHEGFYVPLTHCYEGAPEQLDKQRVLSDLQTLLGDASVTWVGQHVKYDMHILAREGVDVQCQLQDTMLQSYCIDSVGSRHDMDSLAQRYLQHTTTSFDTIAGKGVKQKTFDQIELEVASHYAAEDADVTWSLHQRFNGLLSESAGVSAVYDTIERPLIPVLQRMEHRGVLIDASLLTEMSAELAGRLTALESQAHEEAGQAFNLGSPKQLGEILFDRLQMPVIKKTPKGAPSTAEAVLQELAMDYELPKLLLEHRSLSKLKSTYTDKLPELVNGQTGRVHTSYHQAVTATGRLSSSDPNLQNIPIRTDDGRRIRYAFVAPAGKKLIAADYSQIELRIMAHYSQDASLLEAFANNQDVHARTASEVFNVPLDEVDGDLRRRAKAINFGLMYGMSAFGLARQLGIGRYEAQDYIDCYFDRYPGVLKYMEGVRTQAHENGFVETLSGRRLYLPEISSRNRARQQAAERTAINAPLQGTAADIIKRAMISIDQALQSDFKDSFLVMQVHDELVIEAPSDQVDGISELLTTQMSGAMELSVPLTVEVGVGDSWGEAH